jgi:lipid-A-disaccharide synthase
LMQENCNQKNLKIELNKILEPKNRERLIMKYDILEKKLGGIGASQKTAKLIVADLQNS